MNEAISKLLSESGESPRDIANGFRIELISESEHLEPFDSIAHEYRLNARTGLSPMVENLSKFRQVAEFVLCDLNPMTLFCADSLLAMFGAFVQSVGDEFFGFCFGCEVSVLLFAGI